MTNRAILGNINGQYKLRATIPGFDASDLTLPPEYVSFDSDWAEMLTVTQTGVVLCDSANIGYVSIPYTPTPNRMPMMFGSFKEKLTSIYNPGKFFLTACAIIPTAYSVSAGKLYGECYYLGSDACATMHYALVEVNV